MDYLKLAVNLAKGEAGIDVDRPVETILRESWRIRELLDVPRSENVISEIADCKKEIDNSVATLDSMERIGEGAE